MKAYRFGRVARLAALTGLVSGLSACAMFGTNDINRPIVAAAEAPAGDTPVIPPAVPAEAPTPASNASPAVGAASATPVAMDRPAPTPAVSSTVAELEALIQSRQVSELRTTYNGSYGASLLFKADDLTYFVTLFQQKNFWRVVRTVSEKQAESTFRAFVQQSADLAEVEMRRIKLEADYAHSERVLATRTEQLNTLQADQAIRRQQAMEVEQRQAQTREQAAALAEMQANMRRELRDLQRQIDALEADQSKVGPTEKPKRR